MAYNKFRIRFFARAVVLAVLIVAFNFALQQESWKLTPLVLLILCIISFVELIFFAEQTNNDIARLLKSLKHNDYTQVFDTVENEMNNNELRFVIQQIINEIQKNRLEKEIQYQYLHLIIENITIGLICFDKQEKVHFANKAATNILNINKLNNLEIISTRFSSLYKKFTENHLNISDYCELKVDDALMLLSVRRTIFKIKSDTFYLISLQNIRNELDKQEVQSWQKLIRVLRHEIMNSVTPITSLISAVNSILEKDDGTPVALKDVSEDDAFDLVQSLKTVENRSRNLMKFISSYKNISNIPSPQYEKIVMLKFLSEIKKFMSKQIEEKNINFVIKVEPFVTFFSDAGLLEQIFINLILNSIEALHETNNAKISIEGKLFQNEINIFIEDNGKGIKNEDIDKIFIPFYTTRKNGSGIGLSLTKQIVTALNGNITVHSEINLGTTFYLNFPVYNSGENVRNGD